MCPDVVPAAMSLVFSNGLISLTGFQVMPKLAAAWEEPVDEAVPPAALLLALMPLLLALAPALLGGSLDPACFACFGGGAEV